MKCDSLQVVGGTFSRRLEERKSSSVAIRIKNKLSEIMSNKGATITYGTNGGRIGTLNAAADSLSKGLTVWMPNVSNDEDKIYPKKPMGGVLICSKVLRKNRTVYDAVGRIFKMHANAVIAIDTSNNKFEFTLLDALGNVWVKTSVIDTLAKYIYKFYNWAKETQRIGSTYHSSDCFLGKGEYTRMERFCKLNTLVADKVEGGDSNRYFGNCSTRCSLMFPSTRSFTSTGILVSRRNSNKKRLAVYDMVRVHLNKNKPEVIYYGDKEVKPSVDTPIQLQLYSRFPAINYMIHGHAYIKGAPLSDTYYACGDIREVNCVEKEIQDVKAGAINLKNHGFLLYSKSLEDMERYVKNLSFTRKVVGEDFVGRC